MSFTRRNALSDRESQVVLYSACGLRPKQIAALMSCSPKTVEEYWSRIYRKTGKACRLEVLSDLLVDACLDRVA